ncbi:MAG: hypothetical protein JXQ83_15400, partial [Candidatus Glassbacteria bacterium]|nr:hypothetical protein [Candidatus Glassbacteria bacterium]
GPLEEPVAEAPVAPAAELEKDLAGSEEPAPAADLEANLSADLEKDLAGSAEPSRPADPAAEGTLDLDAIMSAAGTGTAVERQTGEAPETRGPEVESEPEHGSADEDLDLETEIRLEPVETEQAGGNGRGEEQDAQTAGEADWVREEEYPVEEPADSQGPGETPEPPARRALSLDERLELSLDVGRMDDESQTLSVNQTIDAIKKKTVKCPSCGTMNYAIRWYCENCEATLTTL